MAGHRIQELFPCLGVSQPEQVAVLTGSERRLRRACRSKQLPKDIASQVLLLEGLAAHGLSVFDDKADLFKPGYAILYPN